MKVMDFSADEGDSTVHKIEKERHFAAAKEEIEILKDLKGIDGVPSYETSCVSESRSLVLVVMQYIEGIELKDWLKDPANNIKDKRKQIFSIFQSLAGILKLVEEKGIIHRDIKPDNIMVIEGDLIDEMGTVHLNANGQIEAVKLIDFGQARVSVQMGAPRRWC